LSKDRQSREQKKQNDARMWHEYLNVKNVKQDSDVILTGSARRGSPRAFRSQE
jgi:hypothetical protein